MIRWGMLWILCFSSFLSIGILQWRVQVMFEQIEKLQLLGTQPEEQIIITLADERYHRHKCPRIRGETEIVYYRSVSNLFIDPCTYCFGKVNGNNKTESENYYGK